VTSSALRAGWGSKNNDTHSENMARSVILDLGLSCSAYQVITPARAMFDRLKIEGKLDEKSRDLLPTVLAAGAQRGRTSDYDWLLQRYKDITTPTEKEEYMISLCLFEDERLIKRTLDLSIDDKWAKPKDTSTILKNIADNTYAGRQLAWNFLTKNWQKIISRTVGSVFNLAESVHCKLGFIDMRQGGQRCTLFF